MNIGGNNTSTISQLCGSQIHSSQMPREIHTFLKIGDCIKQSEWQMGTRTETRVFKMFREVCSSFWLHRSLNFLWSLTAGFKEKGLSRSAMRHIRYMTHAKKSVTSQKLWVTQDWILNATQTSCFLFVEPDRDSGLSPSLVRSGNRQKPGLLVQDEDPFGLRTFSWDQQFLFHNSS